MRKSLLSSAAALAMIAGTTAIAAAECEIVSPQLEERVAADPDARAGFSASLMRDVRDLRDAARTLAMYGQEDACEEVAEAINEILDNPEEARAEGRDAQVNEQAVAERREYTFEKTVPVSEGVGRLRAEAILGADVRGSNNETIGEISDLVFDTSGAPAYAVIAYGGFLGLGEEESAVPFKMLRVSEDGDVFYVDLTEEQIENAPRFERGTFDWVKDDAWREENDKYYMGSMENRG